MSSTGTAKEEQNINKADKEPDEEKYKLLDHKNAEDIKLPPQSEEGERMTKLRTNLDKTVDKLIAKLRQNYFVNAMPQDMSREEVAAYQSKFCALIRTQICQTIEKEISDGNVAASLNKLEELIKTTPHPLNHVAWRPPAHSTMENCLVAHDLQVALQHKEKLASLLSRAEADCKDLMSKVADAERRTRENQVILTNLEKNKSDLINNVVDTQQLL